MRYPRQQGLAMVEFAIVLPLLLLLMFVAAEFGRALFQYNTLIKAVRDGARYLSQNAFIGSSTIVDTGAKTEAGNLVVYGAIGKTTCDAHGPCDQLPGFKATDVTTPDPELKDGTYYVTVSTTYTYQPMLGAILPLTATNVQIPLKAAVTMRVL